MRIIKPVYLITLVALGLATAAAQNTPAIKRVPARMTRSVEGKDLFRQFCAVCHGLDAKGGGPGAPALKKAPTDLTQLSRKNGGKFPILAVKIAITGEAGIIEHGTREMPMWGDVLTESGQQVAMGQMRVQGLLDYLEQIQSK